MRTRNNIILLLVLLTIVFNCFLIYGLLWNPYNLYFDRPELSSTPYETREIYAKSATITNLIILLGLTVIMVFKYWKTKKFFLPAPLFSLFTFLILLQVQSFYPDSQTSYTKDEYRYLEQSWHLKGNNIFKKFKSDKPENAYPEHRAIIWKLESINEGKTIDSEIPQKVKTENKLDYIVFGRYCGECGGECATMYKLDIHNNNLFVDHTDSYWDYKRGTPMKFGTAINNKSKMLLARQFLESIPKSILDSKKTAQRFGSPDGEDGCGIFLEIKSDTIIKKFYIDNQTERLTGDIKIFAENFKKIIDKLND